MKLIFQIKILDELLSGVQLKEILHVLSDVSIDLSSIVFRDQISLRTMDERSIETSDKTWRISFGWNPESNPSTSFDGKAYIQSKLNISTPIRPMSPPQSAFALLRAPRALSGPQTRTRSRRAGPRDLQPHGGLPGSRSSWHFHSNP
jgi:hypothetical protein